MVYAIAQLKDKNAYGTGLQYKVGGNSLAFQDGDFLKLSGSNLIMADGTTAIEGVCISTKTTASDNTTVAKLLIGYISHKNTTNTYKLPITGGTITIADEGKYFNIVASTQYVDGTTESTTTGQLRLENYLSATTGLFSIVNLFAF